MLLQIGTREPIQHPTPEQIVEALRDLPANAPFIILSSDDEQFIQATPTDNAWRVEWRQEAEQRYMLVTQRQAEEALLVFRRWDESALSSFPWKRLTMWNDPYHCPLFVIAAIGIVALVALWRVLH